MTLFALCTARSSFSRTMASELTDVRHRRHDCMSATSRFQRLLPFIWLHRVAEDRYFAHSARRGAVQLIAEPVAARLRSGAEAPGPNSTSAASRQLQITRCCPAVCAATAVPLGLRHVGLGRAG